jgi:hypothetical protein
LRALGRQPSSGIGLLLQRALHPRLCAQLLRLGKLGLLLIKLVALQLLAHQALFGRLACAKVGFAFLVGCARNALRNGNGGGYGGCYKCWNHAA